MRFLSFLYGAGGFSVPYLLVFLSAAGVASFSAADVLWFRQTGLSFADIGLMSLVFNIAVSCAELPFALLFDKHSAKWALGIGFSLRIAAFLLFAAQIGFAYFLLAQALAGLAAAAAATATGALVMNGVQQQTEAAMAAARSRLRFLSAVAALLGATLGIVLFRRFPAGIWWLAALFFTAALLALRFMPRQKAEAASVPLRQLARACALLLRQRAAWLLIMANAAAIAPLLFWQVKFSAAGSGFVVLGSYLMILSAAFAARLSLWLRAERLSLRAAAALNLAAIGCFAAARGLPALLLSFACCIIAHILLVIKSEAAFHALLGRQIRASGMALVSLADSLLAAAFAPLTGRLADAFGMAAGFGVSAALYLLLMLLAAQPAATEAAP